MQLVKISGDNKNVAGGLLAVQDRGTVALSFVVPIGFGVSFDKTGKSQGSDTWSVDRPRTTAGMGKACRAQRMHGPIETRRRLGSAPVEFRDHALFVVVVEEVQVSGIVALIIQPVLVIQLRQLLANGGGQQLP